MFKTDIRRIICINFKRIVALLNIQNVTTISKYYYYLNKLIVIRRSFASVLIANKQSDKIMLKSIISKHKIKTVELKYKVEEVVKT